MFESDGKQLVIDHEPITRRYLDREYARISAIDQSGLNIYDPYEVVEWLLQSGELLKSSSYIAKLVAGIANSPRRLPDLLISDTNESLAHLTYSVERFRQTDGRKIVIPEKTGKLLTTEYDLLMYEDRPTSDNYRCAFGTRPWAADEIEFDYDNLTIKRIVEQTRSNREDYISDKERRFVDAQARYPNVFDSEAILLFGVPSDSLLPIPDERKYKLPYDVTTLNELALRVYRYYGSNLLENSPREVKEKKKRQKNRERRYIYT